ncbi:MAG: TIGR03790 family protein, partial [Planctomycetes bacterium]|nr:TIGR03790 family protein [Planctomycetota bacterium]
MPCRPLVSSLIIFFASSAAALAATPAQVLMVVNDSSAESQAIGSYYAALRSLPAENVFHLPAGTPTAETIARATYNAQVRDPIAQYLSVTQPHLQDQILYIVLAKYVPLRISGSSSEFASVESELCLLFTGLLGDNGQNSWLANPYFNKDQSFASLTSLSPKYLVCRIDGFDGDNDPGSGVPGDVKALMDRAMSPAAAGVFLLDQDPSKTGGYASGNNWMITASDLLLALGQTVQLDATTTFQANVSGILGYASWGSNDSYTAGPPYYGEVPAGSGNVYPGSFVHGALVTDYVSTNGRTFLKASATYGQSLVADLIHLGASGCAGYVYEPYLNAVVHPDILFSRFLTGYDAIEAYYMAMPYLSWQNIVVVDPLMKSAVSAAFPPQVASVFPDRGAHGGGGVVTIGGKYLGEPGDPVTVRFGGVASPSASFIAAHVIQAAVPANEPGAADVEVIVSGGTAALEDAFLFLPALRLTGSSSIGQIANLEINGQMGESFLLYLGS